MYSYNDTEESIGCIGAYQSGKRESNNDIDESAKRCVRPKRHNSNIMVSTRIRVQQVESVSSSLGECIPEFVVLVF